MKTFIFTAIMLLLSGCATSPIALNDAQTVPPDRVFRTEISPAQNNATAIFVRDAGFAGAAVYQHLFIDGTEAARLNPGEKVEFILAPGEHIFGVVPTNPFGTSSFNSIDQDLKPGQRYFYRIQTDGNSFRSVVQRFLPPSP